MRCAIYTRVSKAKVQTTDNQLLILREVAQMRGFEIAREYTDEGISGAKGRESRAGFDALIKASVKREHDIVLCWSVCRLGRDLSHLVSFLNEMNAVGVDVYCHSQGLDTSSISGRMTFHLCGILAEFEREILKQRIVAGQNRARAEGKHIGRKSNMSDGLIQSVKFMREQGLGIKHIAKQLNIGIGSVYRALEHS